MKNTITIEKTYKHEHVESTECDICHNKFDGERWNHESYSALETEVRMKTGTSYPEGGSGEEIKFDICPKCFREKLIPFIESFGTVAQWKDWDF
jgi:hypothetical protein